MTKEAYSTDLRSRVIDYIQIGKSQRLASIIFKVSTSAISRWWIRYCREGTISAKAKGGSKGKIDEERLGNYVEANPDKTLKEIGQHFGVSGTAISNRLKKLGFGYKKKPLGIWKRIRRNENNIWKQ